MRLLIVTNMYPPMQVGGYELSCQAFVDHMIDRGADLRVLTAEGPRSEHDGSRVLRELWCYLTPSGEFLSPSWTQRWHLERLNHRAFMRQVSSLRPDAVMWWNMGGVSLSLIERAHRLGLPATGVVCDNWMQWSRYRDPWHRAGLRWPAARPWAGMVARVPLEVNLSGAARWVFVSENVRRKAVREIGPLERTEIVHSGIPIERYRRRDPGTPWQNRLLVVGRVTESKGVDTALRVLGLLPHMRLTIVGAGEPDYLAELRGLASRLSIADRVRWLGGLHPDQVATTYAEHDALLFPIRWEEPWGKVPLEAMASGVPVAATPRGGSAEYLRDGTNCLTGDTEQQLARAIARLAGDRDLRSALIAGGYETAAGHDVARANALRESALETALREQPRRSSIASRRRAIALSRRS